jgi:hypothetical protein
MELRSGLGPRQALPDTCWDYSRVLPYSRAEGMGFLVFKLALDFCTSVFSLLEKLLLVGIRDTRHSTSRPQSKDASSHQHLLKVEITFYIASELG